MKYLTIIALAFALASCGEEPRPASQSEVKQQDSEPQKIPSKKYVTQHNTKIEDVTLPDGTRCILSYQKETLFCQFPPPPVNGAIQ